MAVDSAESVIDLDAVRFDAHERQVATHGAIRVSAFSYRSGIAALRIANAVGEMIVLPWHGQQIWDANFHGRRLTMGSVFDKPQAGSDYVRNYGAFLLHCGATAMGNPQPEDKHPVHGELPNAQMQAAQLLLGHDERGAYVKIASQHDQRVAFSTHYRFEPILRLDEQSGRIGLDLTIQNLRTKPMDLMYLAHVNFRPVDGARIVDAVPDDAAHFRVRTHLPSFAAAEDSYRELMGRFKADPASHRVIEAGRPVDPELVAGIDCVAGRDGWSHALQVLPDGAADFISHRPAELDKAVRWMTRNGSEDALGLVLPSTAEADGLAAERRKGNVKALAPGATFKCSLAFGALTAEEAAATARLIEAARGR